MLDRLSKLDHLTIKVITNLADLLALEPHWRDLEKRLSGVTVFQNFSWCRIALEETAASHRIEIRLFCAFDNDTLVALLPLKIWLKRGRRVLTGLAEPFQEFSDILIDNSYSSEAIYKLLHPALVACDADYIHLGQVRADSALFMGATGHLPSIGEADGAPYVDLTKWKDFDSYNSSLKPQTRKVMRNLGNRLQREGNLHHVRRETSVERVALMERTFENRAAWLEEKGLASSAFSDEVFFNFLRRLNGEDHVDLEILATSLMLDDIILAEQWGVVYQGRYHAYMTHWNHDYALYSPGRKHLAEVIKTCYGLGLEGVDFMLPVVAYKQTFASDIVAVQDLGLGLTLKGKLYINVWNKWLRPNIKTFAYSMPTLVRRTGKGVLRLFGGRV